MEQSKQRSPSPPRPALAPEKMQRRRLYRSFICSFSVVKTSCLDLRWCRLVNPQKLMVLLLRRQRSPLLLWAPSATPQAAVWLASTQEKNMLAKMARCAHAVTCASGSGEPVRRTATDLTKAFRHQSVPLAIRTSAACRANTFSEKAVAVMALSVRTVTGAVGPATRSPRPATYKTLDFNRQVAAVIRVLP